MNARHEPTHADDYPNSQRWAKPIPLDPRPALPPFPVSVLPEPVGQFVLAVSKSTQTPVDLAGTLVLSATAAIVSSLTLHIRRGFGVPLNLYTICVLAVGEGKSPVYREIISPLRAIEEQLQDEARPIIAKKIAEQKVAQANLSALEKRLTQKNIKPQERANLIPQLQDAQLALEAITVPAPPRLYAQDATPEGLLKLLAEQGGRIALLDDEGGELIELLSRYGSGGRSNVGVYLRGHDGGRLTTDRSTKAPVDIDAVRLTLGVTVQPKVIHDLARDPTLRGRGLLARILFSVPASIVGFRRTSAPPIPGEVAKVFSSILSTLSELTFGSGAPQLSPMRLTRQARERFDEWSQNHERRLRPSGDLASVADWANKLPGQVGRLAGILHAMSFPEDPTERRVTSRTIESAIQVAEYFTEHSMAVFGLIGLDPEMAKALQMGEWLRDKAEKGEEQVTRRDFQRARPALFRRAEDVEPVLKVLFRHRFLKKAPPSSRRVGRPSEVLLINPRIADNIDRPKRIAPL